MTITLKADIPQDAAFTAGAGATSPVAWTYNVLDASGVGGVLATSPVYAVRPGQSPVMALTARVPVGNSALALTVTYTYLDVNLAALSSGTLDTFSATSATAPRTVSPPTPPDAARYWYARLVLNEGVSDATLRTNFHPDPRAQNASLPHFAAPANWQRSNVTGLTTGVANITTAVKALCQSAATGTNRGITMWQDPDATSPSYSAVGVPVTPGETITVSAYVRCSRAVTFAAALRFLTSAGAWVAAATVGTSVAVSANTWTRVSVTATVPATAVYMGAAAVRVPASTAWAVNDTIQLTGILIEKTGTVADWFAGDYAISGYSARWVGDAAASNSELYTPGSARNRVLNLSSVTLAASADATEIIAAALTRSLRRSVYDALNVAAPQVAVGTPGLLAGSLTYLCDDLESALAVDLLYQFAGPITLSTGSGAALDGFVHMAVESVRLAAEKALPGKPSRWTVQAEVREIKAAI